MLAVVELEIGVVVGTVLVVLERGVDVIDVVVEVALSALEGVVEVVDVVDGT